MLTVGLTNLLQATVFGNLSASSVGLALSYVLLVSSVCLSLVLCLLSNTNKLLIEYRSDDVTKNFGFQCFGIPCIGGA